MERPFPKSEVIIKADDPRLLPFTSLRDLGHLFIAEGGKVIGHLLESSLDIVTVLSTEAYYLEMRSHPAWSRMKSLNWYIADGELFKQFLGYRFHMGIMAIAEKPQPYSLAEIQGSVLVLNGLTNAENVGSIVRNAVALGCHSLIYDATCPDPYLRRAVRVSMGSIFKMRLYPSQGLCSDLQRLQARNYRIIGSSAQGKLPLRKLPAYLGQANWALVIGSEGEGIDQALLSLCDAVVSIPTSPEMPSLNAAAASAVILYELHQSSVF